MRGRGAGAGRGRGAARLVHRGTRPGRPARTGPDRRTHDSARGAGPVAPRPPVAGVAERRAPWARGARARARPDPALPVAARPALHRHRRGARRGVPLRRPGDTDQDKLDQERAQAREIAHVLAAPDARATSDRDSQGRGIGVVASASERRAVVTLSGLGTPSGGRVHQLWLMRPNVQPRSLGLFEGDTPLIADGLNTNATSLAVTVEPQGGSAQPTTTPVVQLALKSVGFGE
ncbi:anti-sigma factor [Streptomyces sp. S1D4-11]